MKTFAIFQRILERCFTNIFSAAKQRIEYGGHCQSLIPAMRGTGSPVHGNYKLINDITFSATVSIISSSTVAKVAVIFLYYAASLMLARVAGTWSH